MSAIVCGKRSFFEELTVTSPPVVSKRVRCSSSSPVRFSPPRSQNATVSVSFPSSSNFSTSLLIDKLVSLFPDMDKQIIEKALEKCGDDLDSAIRSLNELRLGSTGNDLDSNVVRSDVLLGGNAQPQGERYFVSDIAATNAEAPPSDDPSAPTQLPVDGAQWVELFVREMMSASNMDDASARASRVLEVLEKSICARAGADAAKSLQQDNMVLKEQVQALIQENAILKRAVSIQHERQKELEDKSQELQHLKQLVSQYQDQLRALEVNNYALTMHLKQAQQSSSIPGRFHPDVF